MNRDALLRVVKATRMSMKMAEDMKSLLVNTHTQTIPDCIEGLLTDALFHYSGERLELKQDFDRDSSTMRMLHSNLSDGEVTDELIRMNTHTSPITCEEEEFKNLYRKYGGYMVEEAERPE